MTRQHSPIAAMMLANSFLWPRGYTTVWSGWENNLGPLRTDGDGESSRSRRIRSRRQSPARLRIHRDRRGLVHAGLSGRFIGQDERKADASRSPGRRAAGRPGQRLGLHRRDQHRDQTDHGELRQQRHLRVLLHRERPDGERPGLAAMRDFNSFLRYATQDDFGTPNPLAGDVKRIYTEISSQPGRPLNDFRHLGFNQDENGKKVFDGMMQWIAAGDGLNMNYRWSQTGRTERNRQECSISKACSRSPT